MVTALQSTGVSGAEEESKSAVATYIAQVITFLRQVFAYLMEYMRKMLEWAGEHPLASVLFLTNIMVWIS